MIHMNKGTALTVFTSTPVSLLSVQFIDGGGGGGHTVSQLCCDTDQ